MKTSGMLPFLLGLLLISDVSYSLDRIGKVVAVDGLVTARHPTTGERILVRESEIYVGDALKTADTARGQVQFTDGTLLVLIPNSRLTVDAYAVNKAGGKNEYLARLQEGGTRISTGLIAKRKPENFELGTPNATIGVRGTLFETRIEGGRTYVGSSYGGLSVNNRAGRLDIGDDAATQFADVSSPGSAPRALEARPQALNLAQFAPPAGGIGFEPPVSGAAGAGAGAGATSGMAWGPAIGGLVVIGVVVGAIVVSATSSQTVHFSPAPSSQLRSDPPDND